MKKILLLFLLMFLTIGFSQESTIRKKAPKKDLKVGLVLSGGGAKGFAHVGVLKVLDSLGVRVDYIGGTSAGAMVGALYASGYSGKEIDSIIRSYDFNELIQDKIPREQFSLHQKETSEKYAVTLPLKNWKIGLPVALSKGQNFLNELTKLTKHVHNINDFKKLPIPFYCVATDIENGDQIILNKGFLPLAIKASGAFPSVLEPVEINGRLLVDGGIVNNFPIDIMYKKDVDVIIGVDVQDTLVKRNDLDSAPKILMQIVSFQMYETSVENKEYTDIYIKPNIKDYTVFSFDKAAELILEGKVNAEKEASYLETIAKQQIKKPIHLQSDLNKKESKIFIKNITIKGHKNYTTNYVLSKLNLKRKDSITYKQFNECIKGLSATKNFERIDYKFTLLPDNKTNINFNVKENNSSNSVHLGVHYDDLYKTGVLINFTSKHALTNNDVFSADIVLGDNLRYNVDYIVDNGFHWQFGFKSSYTNFKHNFIADISDISSIFNQNKLLNYNDLTNQFYVQSKFKEKLGFKIGLEYKYLGVFNEDKTTQHKKFFENRSYYSAFGEILLDTYNAKYFTKKGWYFKGNYKVYLASSQFNAKKIEPFTQITAKLGYTKTFFKKLTTQITGNAGFSVGSNAAAFDFYLGGNNKNLINNFEQFYGYDVASINGLSFVKTDISMQYELFKNNYISYTNNFAVVEKPIQYDDDNTVLFINPTFTASGNAIGYGIDSLIGPIEIKYAWTQDNSLNYWYFNIGFWF